MTVKELIDILSRHPEPHEEIFINASECPFSIQSVRKIKHGELTITPYQWLMEDYSEELMKP